MQASRANSMQLACMCLALMVSTVFCLVPSVGTFTLDTIPNRGFKGRNGTAAYLKAVAKYAHLADNDVVSKLTDPSEPCLYFPTLFNIQNKATDKTQMERWWVSTRRTIVSGCALSRLGPLVRPSTWTLILVLRTCKLSHINMRKHTILGSIFKNLWKAGSLPRSRPSILVTSETGAFSISTRRPLLGTMRVGVGPLLMVCALDHCALTGILSDCY